MTPLSLHRSAFLALLCGVLTACGAEVASTAVTATKLQAEQAKQATAQAEKIKAAWPRPRSARKPPPRPLTANKSG